MNIEKQLWPEKVRKKLQLLPKEPGIYKMLDRYGNIIYIGKSKRLKQRVNSYFQDNPKWDKAKKMQPFICDIEFIVTDTHLEAMLLECELIKKVKPFFNVMMKQEERYGFLKVGEYPESALSVSYSREQDCFGPFRSLWHVRDAIQVMEHFYPLQKEKKHLKFEYHFFPEKMDPDVFLENRKLLLKLCKEPKFMEQFVRQVEQKMKQVAAELKFELAGKYKDFLQKFEYVQRGLARYQEFQTGILVITLPVREGYKLFLIENGLLRAKSEVLHGQGDQKQQFIALMEQQSEIEQRQGLQKGDIDYRDIIYHELSGLAKEQIKRLDGTTCSGRRDRGRKEEMSLL